MQVNGAKALNMHLPSTINPPSKVPSCGRYPHTLSAYIYRREGVMVGGDDAEFHNHEASQHDLPLAIIWGPFQRLGASPLPTETLRAAIKHINRGVLHE